MKKSVRGLRLLVLAGCLTAGLGVLRGQMAAPMSHETAVPSGILTREQTANFLPDKVFYRGQSATVQARNSAGVQFAAGRLMLAAVVDTSGYSSSVAQSYQAYLITEVPLEFGGKVLRPGCYGFGFVAGDKMVMMDVGANQLLEAPTARDSELKRPNPLQILADPSTQGHYRLYMGRTYVVFSQVAGK
jgi:hypothetical protein